MSREIICECGHKNPEGTILCEACGKPLTDDQSSKELLNMRYEGSARRSQTYSRTPIDKIWNFFSSVKVGITLIILVLIAIAIGTIFPQDVYIPAGADPKTFYKEQYGVLGEIYKTLGFDHLYGSWWFVILLGLLGLSIIVASIDRFIPLHRALRNQKIVRHDRFMKKQRMYGVTETDDGAQIIDKARIALKERRYNIREDNGSLLAEKGRFSRWGPYVNHIGLIIVLTAGMLRFFPGMYTHEVLWLKEGETAKLPGTHGEYYLKNHKFILETYNQNNKQYEKSLKRAGTVAKNYQSNVTLYKTSDHHVLGAKPELHKVEDAGIRVNAPLEFNHYQVFQADYRLNEFNKMSFKLTNKKTKKSFGKLSVDLFNPKKEYDLGNGYRVKLIDYFPDFYFNDKGEPASKTDVPENPAFIFKMFTPDHPKGEVSFVAIKTNLEPLGKNDYKMTFAGVETKNVSGFVIKKDWTLWIFFVGMIIFLIGVGQGMYWNHRRMWLQRQGNTLVFAGHTNKNWFGLKKDIRFVVEKSGLSEPVDRLEQKSLEKEREIQA
ncbi:cytochrome c biogenesis protein [Scopulibacillus darangshiensis]|uniref:Cytochrome c biogenesis protein n=1 Tax=Scopulibacillus darangshiensis TaxID=442528 RepID=A0A4R2P9I0_9BACL|nr:cytochrome c biogenesis protein ResB [Scopulibacillus darangshiensis]TCP31689.1 cytochrome c biogenesis protein [Scopulibacillus darangshiensis]